MITDKFHQVSLTSLVISLYTLQYASIQLLLNCNYTHKVTRTCACVCVCAWERAEG